MTAHGGSCNEAAVGEVLQLVAVQVGTLLLLASPVSSSILGAVESAIKVGVDNVVVVLVGTVNHGTLGPRDTSVGNEDVETTVQLLNGEVNGLLDGLDVPDVDLVGLGYDRNSKISILF